MRCPGFAGALAGTGFVGPQDSSAICILHRELGQSVPIYDTARRKENQTWQTRGDRPVSSNACRDLANANPNMAARPLRRCREGVKSSPQCLTTLSEREST